MHNLLTDNDILRFMGQINEIRPIPSELFFPYGGALISRRGQFRATILTYNKQGLIEDIGFGVVGDTSLFASGYSLEKLSSPMFYAQIIPGPTRAALRMTRSGQGLSNLEVKMYCMPQN